MHSFEYLQTYVGDILIALNPFKRLEIYHKNVSSWKLKLKLFKVSLFNEHLFTSLFTSLCFLLF